MLDLRDRHQIEDEIERLIGILDAMEPDPDLEETGDLEPSLGWSPDRQCVIETGDDCEADWSDTEPSLGALNVQMPAPFYRLGGGHGYCLFPMHREQCELTYDAAGFSQVGWGEGPRSDLEEVCEDEGAQCDDEGAQWAR
jgi:hypothetical protein